MLGPSVFYRWRLAWYGDVCASGSDLTWQPSGGVGYRLGWGSVVGGWRHLCVVYDKSAVKLDAALTAPSISASFPF